jgi:hypothetical protein
MSTETPCFPAHRQTRNLAGNLKNNPAAPQNPHNPHHLTIQSGASNSQSSIDHSLPPSTPPKTPQRVNHGRSANNVQANAAAESSSKTRSKGKNRLKNNIPTPPVTKSERNMTPSSATAHSTGMHASTRPVSIQADAAYAGPTFHASPLPSALPIPSFYSKSFPDSPSISGFKKDREETASSGSESPTPPPAKISTQQSTREESPLDFFFKKDREEKARANSTSSFGETGVGPHPSPSESPQNGGYRTPGNKGHGRNMSANLARGSAGGMFAMELDGNTSPGTPYGRPFSTPYHERISAAKSATNPLKPTSPDAQTPTDKSEALKALLFGGRIQNGAPIALSSGSGDTALGFNAPLGSVSSNRTASAQGAGLGASSGLHNSFPHLNNSMAQNNSPRNGSRSSGLRQELTPTKTPTNQSPQRNSPFYSGPATPSRVSRGNSPAIFQGYGNDLRSGNPSPQNIISPSATPSALQSSDLRGMEDSLRRILKLEPSSNSGLQAGASRAVPTASASVPNYVGGRAPPMNGLHNGFMGS